MVQVIEQLLLNQRPNVIPVFHGAISPTEKVIGGLFHAVLVISFITWKFKLIRANELLTIRIFTASGTRV